MYVTLAGAGIVHLRKIKNMAIIILTTTSTHKSCSGSSADGAPQNAADTYIAAPVYLTHIRYNIECYII